MNCLGYALRFWERYPEYRLYYNSGHVINSPVLINKEAYLPAEDFGYDYFHSAFEGLIDSHEEDILKRYFGKL